MRRFCSMLVTVAVVAAGVFWIAGCGGGPYAVGRAIPEGDSALGVRQVLEDPDGYLGEVIVVEGFYGAGVCASCFQLKDGTASLEVETSAEVGAPPRSELNKKMRVIGVLRAGAEPGQPPSLVAEGVEFE